MVGQDVVERVKKFKEDEVRRFFVYFDDREARAGSSSVGHELDRLLEFFEGNRVSDVLGGVGAWVGLVAVQPGEGWIVRFCVPEGVP